NAYEWARTFATLAADADVAARAAAAAEVGETRDAQRYSDLAGLIELRALAYGRDHPDQVRSVTLDPSAKACGHSWWPATDSGAFVVQVSEPFSAGPNPGPDRPGIPAPLEPVDR